MLLYNGILLPKLPSWDSTTYKVSVISRVESGASAQFAGAQYILVLGASIMWQNSKCYVSNITGVYRFNGSAWVWHYGSGTTYTQDIVASGFFEAVWTNTTIPVEYGEGVYLAASLPVDPNAPEQPEEPEEPEEPVAPVDAAKIFRRGWMSGFVTGLNVRAALAHKVIEEPDEPITSVTYNWDDFSATSTVFGDYAFGQLPLTLTGNYTSGGNYVEFPHYIHLFPEGKAPNISKGDKIDITVYTPEMTCVFYGSAMLEEIDFSLVFVEKNYSSSSNNGMSYFRHHITENRFDVINGATSSLSPVFEPESLVYEVFYDGDKVIGFHAQGIASVDIDYLSIGSSVTADRYTSGYSMRWQFTNSNPLSLTITKE